MDRGSVSRTRRSVLLAIVVAMMVAGALTLVVGPTRAGRSSAADDKAVGRKKLIEVGWDAPTPDHLRKHIKEAEHSPFSGIMVNLNAGKTFLNKVPYPESAFKQDRKDLAAIAPSKRNNKLTDNFVTVWSAREEGWDWFNDSHWSAAEANARNFAKSAKAGGFAGLMFDPEPYGTSPWEYSAELYPSQTFVSVQAKVRQRGAAFMSAVQREMPKVTILLLFGPSIVKEQADARGSLEKAIWALWASFIDGMLDTIGPDARLVEGNEQSYYNTYASDFDYYRTFKGSSKTLMSPKNHAKYDRQMSIGQSVFVDGVLNLLNSPRFFGYYLANDAQRLQFLEYNAFHALRTTDEYVWLYNEQVDWWNTLGKGKKLPARYEDLLKRMEQGSATKAAVGPDVESFAPAARDKHQRKVQINGRVTTNGSGEAGKGLGGVAVEAGFIFEGRDYACQITEGHGYYQCIVPPGWSGRVTPKSPSYQFNPPFFEVSNASRQTDNANFEGNAK